MHWRKSKSIETKIARLVREIAEIDEFFYKGNASEDRLLYAGMLERKRDDMVRSAVLQLHTAIEDVLNSYIICIVLNTKPEERSRKMRSHGAHALRKMLFGASNMGFDMKLNLALTLRLITAKTKDKLMLLNTTRNKCSHNWLLKAPVRRGKRPKQKKPPLLLYGGQDLHSVAVLKEVLSEYSLIYAKLFLKYLGD